MVQYLAPIEYILFKDFISCLLQKNKINGGRVAKTIMIFLWIFGLCSWERIFVGIVSIFQAQFCTLFKEGAIKMCWTCKWKRQNVREKVCRIREDELQECARWRGSFRSWCVGKRRMGVNKKPYVAFFELKCFTGHGNRTEREKERKTTQHERGCLIFAESFRR